ncbi:MAG: SUMF1/EgtB/PvdO family nonheme iron enzyme [Anaerolineales bacterium]|nr:SUMF1/EgtB/PvdO family nonheme iron enzyme [Anaerolineales bacterium]
MEWITCPRCNFEFRSGQTSELTCPLCGNDFEYDPGLTRPDSFPFTAEQDTPVEKDHRTPPFVPSAPEPQPAVEEQPMPQADIYSPLPNDTLGSLLTEEIEAEEPSNKRIRIKGSRNVLRLVVLVVVFVCIIAAGALAIPFVKPMLSAALASNPQATDAPAIIATFTSGPTETTIPEATDDTLPPPEPTPIPSETPVSELGIGSTLISEQDGMTMVYVPEGEFPMGSEIYAGSERPVHNVYLDAYWIDQTEVTNAQYAQFLNEMGNQVEEGSFWFNEGKIEETDAGWVILEGFGDQPATYVTWYGARAYCEWAGKRLPTEAEWEKAARGTDERLYPWGDDAPTCDLAQFDECNWETLPVGSYPDNASPYGALDMAGNVWEWVFDRYDSGYYGLSSSENPTGPEDATWRVMRGGAWDAAALELRTTIRFKVSLGWGGFSSGFRCVMEP